MTAALQARELGKRYGRRWALSDCTLSIPAGHVTGLVGPNGAGKTTLLKLAVGLLAPTTGSVEVLGHVPGRGARQLTRIGFVAQEAPLYSSLTVADHLTLGTRMNPAWDAELAERRVSSLGLDRAQRAGRLSGGQRAQLALTLALAKRPELLILDEPIASLDPLARRDFLRTLMEATVEQELTVLMSSHLISDLERTCDYLVVLVASQVRVAGEVDELLASHYQVTGPRCEVSALPPHWEIVSASHIDRQTTLIVRSVTPILDAGLAVAQVGLEDLVLAYLSPAARPAERTIDPALEAQR
jgi:ABC-2 type transport system ATP-binding protein